MKNDVTVAYSLRLEGNLFIRNILQIITTFEFPIRLELYQELTKSIKFRETKYRIIRVLDNFIIHSNVA